MDNGHWQYPEIIDPNYWFGFIYRIVENNTGREYIGKKQFWKMNRKVVKGRTNRKKIYKESDWKTYAGSSDSLTSAINSNGITNYTFFIESLHATKGSLYYAEVEKQIMENVLREKLIDCVTPKYYNRQIAGVRFIPPDQLSEESFADVRNYLFDGTWLNRISGLSGSDNPRFGKKDVKNGLTFEEYYGADRAIQIKEKLSAANIGKVPFFKGQKHSEETKRKMKGDSRRSHAGSENGMYGKPCHYKMSDIEKQEWKANIGKAGKGKIRSADTRIKMSEASKGKPKNKVVCPHCNKEGGAGNMKRYHFDFCKKTTGNTLNNTQLNIPPLVNS